MNMLQALQKKKLISVYRDSAGQRSAIWWLPELTQVIENRS